MTSYGSRTLLLDLLSQIERREVEVLAWGGVDAAFTREELQAIALDQVERDPGLATLSPAELVDELVDHDLLFRIPGTETALFRSRMAETVRLLARLRQIFRGQQWRAGRSLVADYQFVIRPRERPIRELSVDAVVERLKEAIDLAASREALLRAALTPQSGSLCLTRFQYRATEYILRALDGGRSAGAVIASSTGSGKTLGFYLSALVHIGELIGPGGEHWTKAIALYPRGELLKDQLRSSFASARNLDAEQARRGRRKIRVGAWFLLTPVQAQHIPEQWRKNRHGAICPYFACPDCGSDLTWLTIDRTSGVERLTCTDCGRTVGDDELVLTRESMRHNPPDLLLTTTESLNRQMASIFNAGVFGVGARHKPRLCLLDEIHTYDGAHGAQVALLLRRWRRALGSHVVFVGLSATLTDASRFMADLAGLADHQVVVIEPAEDQLETYGMEYLIALRHDPGSQTTPISVTIQTAMLLARALDPPGGGTSGGTFGERLFVFTDRLDSVNRLYWDILDAEGWWRPGSPMRHYNPLSLATLRAPDVDEPVFTARTRFDAGQSWDLCQRLGHQLLDDRQLRVGRTSSQDLGVATDAEVIAATASLEVGFDDDRVGGVIQHKAPYDGAHFLQRKGRAGRRPDSRPWTAVVLSDYGRDRVAYQGYDQLFSPVLEARHLPVGSRYVMRMQAVYALIDWLCRRADLRRGWQDLAGPAEPGSPAERGQRRAAAVLTEVLRESPKREAFIDHLQRTLRLDDDDLHAVLWEAPRPLLTGAIPTLLRRLSTGWFDGTRSGGEKFGDVPLPEFAPANLFSDLLAPVVGVTIPASHRGPTGAPDELAVEQAVRELCPGNVSRRYAVRDRSERHWAPVPDAPTVRLDTLANYRWLPQGRAEWIANGHQRAVWCFQPAHITLEQTPSGVTDACRSIPRWQSAIAPLSPGRALPISERSTWNRIISEGRSFLHRDDTAARIARFAPELEVSRRAGGVTTITKTALTVGVDDEPAGIGFSYDGDAIQLLIQTQPTSHFLEPAILAESRAAFLYDSFERGMGFPPHVSSFHRHWLRIALLIALLHDRHPSERGLGPSVVRLSEGQLQPALRSACQVLFQAAIENDGTDHAQDGTPSVRRGELHDALMHLIDDPIILAAVGDLAHIVHGNPAGEWTAWETKRFAATVGAVLVEAAADLCPEVDVDDLVVDIAETGDIATTAVWVTEASPGGAGVIERIVDRWTTDPARFLRIMRRRLGPSDFESLDTDLTRVTLALRQDALLREAFHAARDSWTAGHEAAAEGIRAVRNALVGQGVVPTRQLLVSINTRLLAPGTGPVFDELLGDFIDSWSATEHEADIALESRVAAALFVDDSRIDQALHLDLSASDSTPSDRYAALLAICWPRSADLRAVVSAAPNRYQRLPPPTKARVLGRLQDEEALVDVTHTDDLFRQLVEDGSALLVAGSGEESALRRQLLAIATTPADCGFLLSFGRVVSAEREPAGLRLRLELPELQE